MPRRTVVPINIQGRNTLFTRNCPECAPDLHLDRVDPSLYNRFGWYITGNWGDTLATTFYPPNMPYRVALAAGMAHTRAAASRHAGGFHAAMADGSARFIKDTIQTWKYDPISGQPAGASESSDGSWTNLPPAGVWQALSTRAGGEVIGDF